MKYSGSIPNRCYHLDYNSDIGPVFPVYPGQDRRAVSLRMSWVRAQSCIRGHVLHARDLITYSPFSDSIYLESSNEITVQPFELDHVHFCIQVTDYFRLTTVVFLTGFQSLPLHPVLLRLYFRLFSCLSWIMTTFSTNAGPNLQLSRKLQLSRNRNRIRLLCLPPN